MQLDQQCLLLPVPSRRRVRRGYLDHLPHIWIPVHRLWFSNGNCGDGSDGCSASGHFGLIFCRHGFSLMTCIQYTLAPVSIRVPKIFILQICLIFKRMDMKISIVPALPLSLVSLDISPDQQCPHGQDVDDKDDIETKVDIQRVVVPRCPSSLEQLRSNGVARCPRDD